MRDEKTIKVVRGHYAKLKEITNDKVYYGNNIDLLDWVLGKDFSGQYDQEYELQAKDKKS